RPHRRRDPRRATPVHAGLAAFHPSALDARSPHSADRRPGAGADWPGGGMSLLVALPATTSGMPSTDRHARVRRRACGALRRGGRGGLRMTRPLLTVTSLVKHFEGSRSLGERLSGKPKAVVKALNDVSFEVR